MPAHEPLPPELRPTDEPASRSDRRATRFFASHSAHRTIAWVVIAAMFLLPIVVDLVNVLTR